MKIPSIQNIKKLFNAADAKNIQKTVTEAVVSDPAVLYELPVSYDKIYYIGNFSKTIKQTDSIGSPLEKKIIEACTDKNGFNQYAAGIMNNLLENGIVNHSYYGPQEFPLTSAVKIIPVCKDNNKEFDKNALNFVNHALTQEHPKYFTTTDTARILHACKKEDGTFNKKHLKQAMLLCDEFCSVDEIIAKLV